MAMTSKHLIAKCATQWKYKSDAATEQMEGNLCAQICPGTTNTTDCWQAPNVQACKYTATRGK